MNELFVALDIGSPVRVLDIGANPLIEGEVGKPEDIAPVDLVDSFLSCGFQSPVDSYLPFFENALMPGGTAIFDLRRNTTKYQARELEHFGTLTYLESPSKARRAMLRKHA